MGAQGSRASLPAWAWEEIGWGRQWVELSTHPQGSSVALLLSVLHPRYPHRGTYAEFNLSIAD